MWRVWVKRGRTGSWWANRMERDHWGDLGVDGWIILRWISRTRDVVCGQDWFGPGYGKVADACECGNEPSGSIKCGEFLDWLENS